MQRPTIVIDFDGVINSYTSGWSNGAIKDPPVEGTGEALRELMLTYDIVVNTSRHDLISVSTYIHHHFGYACVIDTAGTMQCSPNYILVTNYKYPAVMYIDDRGFHFTAWSTTLAEVRHRAGKSFK